jgi:hypothetical protein
VKNIVGEHWTERGLVRDMCDIYRYPTLISAKRKWRHSGKFSLMTIEICALQSKGITNLDLLFQVFPNTCIAYVIISCDQPRKRISALWSLRVCSSFTEQKSDPYGCISRSVGANFALFIPCIFFQLLYHPTYTLLWCTIYNRYQFLHISARVAILRYLWGQRCISQHPNLLIVYCQQIHLMLILFNLKCLKQ